MKRYLKQYCTNRSNSLKEKIQRDYNTRSWKFTDVYQYNYFDLYGKRKSLLSRFKYYKPHFFSTALNNDQVKYSRDQKKYNNYFTCITINIKIGYFNVIACVKFNPRSKLHQFYLYYPFYCPYQSQSHPIWALQLTIKLK